ncbi:Manganese-dependent 2,3-dihydroxybiphenyl 1,2-dioxygenase [Emticicia aquatica]|uniref:Manganese-dependent 2,3-dihydroxybiphenyl 1,2-dioxygenase n=1 Tax=Emticicia aquatica TaxID=1681835 RepID=A0ABM9ALL7_9BACT|nr:VOC family protein [Emticicia aquatica]CAH0994665.1 Manganese-dependent 2,3-dihydroxybiphenyl 1,2-dioxygenase [Emticicia aquatica]
MQATIWDLAHVAHVELFTPKLEESTRFFTEIMGMSISDVKNDSVYLRAYDDYEHHTLKLTAHKHAGMKHFAWRAKSQEALMRRVAAIEKSGYGIGWNDGDLGHGPAYTFQSPSGHLTEIYFETEKYKAVGSNISALKNTASKFPARGINVRRIDHLNLFAKDVRAFRDFQMENLGGILTETIVDNAIDLNPKAVWFLVNSKSYDLAVTEDHLGMNNRFHHVTYAVNSREEVLIAADICLENGIFIETGPHKHTIQQTFFLYVYEPGGNRIEIANTTARLVLDPDYETIVWTQEERKKGQAWGLATVSSFHTKGTPMPEELID